MTHDDTPARPAYWRDVDPDYTVDDWRHDVAEDATRMGYHDWAKAQRDIADKPGVVDR